MAESVELATAYVQIIPSLKGAEAAIQKAFGGNVSQKQGQALGSRMAAAMGAAFKRTLNLGKSVGEAVARAGRSLGELASLVANAVKTTAREFAPLGNAAVAVGKRIVTALQGALSKVAGVASGIGSKVGSALASIGKSVAARFSPITDAVNRVTTATGGALSAWASRVQSTVTGAFQAVASRASASLGAVGQAVATRLAPVTGAVTRIGTAVGSTLSTVGSKVASTVGPAVQAVTGAAGRIAAAWAPVGSKIAGYVSSGISKATGAVGNALGSVLSGGAKAAISAASRIGSSIGDALSSTISYGAKMAGVAIAGLAATITANLGGAIQRADLLNNFPKVMGNIGFSSEEAAGQIKRISEALDGLPTSTQALAATAQGLAPLTGDLTSATDVALALNNALLAGGASSTLAENAMEQFRQMLSLGTVDMAAWRSMVSAMPGQMDMLARSLLDAESNSMDLYEAMKEGTISFDDFNAALIDINQNGSEGMASFADQARAATGGIGTAFTNVGNRIKAAIEKIITAIGVDAISGKINEITAGISGFGGKIAEIITSLKSGGGEGISSFLAPLQGLAPVIGAAAGGLGALASQLPMIGGLFSGLTGPVGATIGLFTLMWSKSEALRTAVGSAFQALGTIFQGMGPTVTALSTAFSGIAKILGDQLGAAINAIVPALTSIAGSIFPTLQNVITSLTPVLNSLVSLLAGILVQAIQILAPILANLASTLMPAIQKVVAALAPPIQQLIAALQPLVQAILPLLGKILGGIMGALGTLAATVLPIVATALGKVISVIASVVSGLTTLLLPAIQTVSNWLSTTFGPTVAKVWEWVKTGASALWSHMQVVWNGIWSVINVVVNWLTTTAWPLIQAAWTNIRVGAQVLWTNITTIWNGIRASINVVVSWFNSYVLPTVSAVWNAIKSGAQTLWTNITTIWNGIKSSINAVATWMSGTLKTNIQNVANGIKSTFQTMKNGITTIWNGVKSAAAKPVNFVINTVYTNGIKKVADSIAKKLGLKSVLPSVSGIPGYASGGVLPGYTPGRDVYHFHSPDGGGSLALSGGEAIMVPEWTRAVGGPRAVAAMNRAARYGRSLPLGDRGQQAFADGGIWDKIKGTVANGASSVADWVASSADALADIVSDPVGAVKNLIKKPVDALLEKVPGDGFFKDMAKALPAKWIDGFATWLKGKTESADVGSASNLVAQARLAMGTPYVWGGVNVPGGVDCSGLIVWALRKMGKNVPRHTAASFQANSTPISSPAPGDLIFWGAPAHHVAIASGGGRMVEAATFGIPVREVPIYGNVTYGRFKYDDGGYLQPGLSLVENLTGKPEPVFTDSQWSILKNSKENSLPDVLEVRIGERSFRAYAEEIADGRIVYASRED